MKEIQLTQGKVAIVDDDDFEWLAQWKWHTDKNGYAIRNVRISTGVRTTLKMHRVILGLKKGDGFDVDHINETRSDNRKSNLRKATRSENLRNQGKYKNNTTGFKGVLWHKINKKWTAQIQIYGKGKHLGCFNTPEEASKAYEKAALELHGEFANIGKGCVILGENKC